MLAESGLLADLRNSRALLLDRPSDHQSPAFSLLGTQITAHALSDEMLTPDKVLSEHERLSPDLHQGDMRAPSRLGSND